MASVGLTTNLSARRRKMKFDNFNSVVDKMIAYESGDMNEEESIEFFQELLDRRLINSLQGNYQRTAATLLELGHIELRKGQQ
jgi:polyhydroxyalkanoate synthesis regulator phasin